MSTPHSSQAKQRREMEQNRGVRVDGCEGDTFMTRPTLAVLRAGPVGWVSWSWAGGLYAA
jgi:hypothetical protein